MDRYSPLTVKESHIERRPMQPAMWTVEILPYGNEIINDVFVAAVFSFPRSIFGCDRLFRSSVLLCSVALLLFPSTPLEKAQGVESDTRVQGEIASFDSCVLVCGHQDPCSPTFATEWSRNVPSKIVD